MSKNKTLMIFSSLLFLAMTACEITVVTPSDYNSSDYSTGTNSEGEVSQSSSTSSEESNVFYSSSIEVENTDGNAVSNSNFTFNNCNATIVTEGGIIPYDSYYVIGNGSNGGSLTITFSNSITIDQIDFDVFSAMSNTLTSTIYYNGSKSFELTLSKNSSSRYVFDEAISLSSIKFVSNNFSDKIKFKRISFSLHERVEVKSISSIKEKTVTVGKEFTIDDCYKIEPSNAFNKEVTLSCSSDNVVISDKKIKCLVEGTYYIKVTTVDGNFETEVKIIANSIATYDCAEKLSRDDTRFTYDDVFSSGETEGVIPSIGSPNIIVVPVNFTDLVSIYDFNNEQSINRLNAAFNGTNEDHTNSYSHSLRSFYNESSYGLLDMNFIISDVFVPSFKSSSFISKESKTDGGGTYAILEEFYKKGKINGQSINFKDSKYDINNDGFVDGIWLIYNDNRSSTSDNYWPYTYWYYALDSQGNIIDSDVNLSCYANCSAYFTYEDSNVGEDYHTLVHETGHMLGLDDYYITDSTSDMSAIGGLDMMDYNVGDHNAFSKYALNWVEPYLLKGEGTITLKPFESSGDCLIVPSSYFNNSAFSEYLIFEYYTPTGLNKLDATNAYPNRDLYFSKNGIRIFHVDARLAKLDYSNSKGYYFSGSYLDMNSSSLSASGYSYYAVGASNTPTYSYNGYHLIEAVTANNVSTYKKSSTSNASLFVDGVFNPSIYTSFFKNSKMHDNSSIEYTFEFVSMNDEECTIKISKK